MIHQFDLRGTQQIHDKLDFSKAVNGFPENSQSAGEEINKG
jgi:hypothetical protein